MPVLFANAREIEIACVLVVARFLRCKFFITSQDVFSFRFNALHFINDTQTLGCLFPLLRYFFSLSMCVRCRTFLLVPDSINAKYCKCEYAFFFHHHSQWIVLVKCAVNSLRDSTCSPRHHHRCCCCCCCCFFFIFFPWFAIILVLVLVHIHFFYSFFFHSVCARLFGA